MDEARIDELEAALNDLDPRVRGQALAELASLAEENQVALEPEKPVANMHAHTFFGFNAYGYSPSYVAWSAKRYGYRLMGKLDFDTLNGIDEFLDVCEMLGVRSSAGVETRVFIPEFADRVINSPGEPGIAYHMGIGFASSHVPESGARLLADMRNRADRRNRALIERVNGYTDPVVVDYDRDVLSLTPKGNATERHIVRAYIQVAEQAVSNPVTFWSRKLGIPQDQMAQVVRDTVELRKRVRAKLMKHGGVGYVQPDRESFPLEDEFNEMVVACGALPCAGWLDGASEGEQAVEELLALHISKGVAALNIIPEYARPRPDDLVNACRLAREFDLPLNVGTEMNSLGQLMIDDLNAPVYGPVRQQFLDGAHFIYGHVTMERSLGLGYQSEWAKSYLPSRRQRNDFYTQVGYRVEPREASRSWLKQLDPTMPPDDVLALMQTR